MKNIKSFNENNKLGDIPQVYYTVFHEDYTKEEQSIIRKHTDASQNGYADLFTVENIYETESDDETPTDLNNIFLNKGFKDDDQVLIHYKW